MYCLEDLGRLSKRESGVSIVTGEARVVDEDEDGAKVEHAVDAARWG